MFHLLLVPYSSSRVDNSSTVSNELINMLKILGENYEDILCVLQLEYFDLLSPLIQDQSDQPKEPVCYVM